MIAIKLEVNKVSKVTMFINEKLEVSKEPPYDPLQSFVRENHIALAETRSGLLSDYVFSAKDVFKVKGSTWGNGHPDWLRHSSPDEYTATGVQELLDHGADLVGKTVCDELCYSISGENWNYGSPLNPHDIRRYAGGSSSGSCVSVAGGLVDFSVGSDCLGSVRVPASYNGLLGIRPTYDRITTRGEVPYCESMDVFGFVAKESNIFQDVAQVLLKEDQQFFDFEKIIIAEDCFNAIDDEVVEHLTDTIEYIKKDFEKVIEREIAPEGLDAWVKTFQIVQGYEVWESYGGFVNKYHPTLSPGPKARLKTASEITRAEYDQALNEKLAIQKYIDDLLADDTVVLLPTASSIAPLKTASQEKINHYRAQSSKLLGISPLSGTPQITIPLAKQEGVPLGISLMGPKGSDRALIDLATKLYDGWNVQ